MGMKYKQLLFTQFEKIEKFCAAQDSAKERAEQIFVALDFNRDGELCENEFVTGCLQVHF